MLWQILLHTPRWVYAIFVVLLVYGLTQLAGRRVSLRAIAVLPVAMSAWSLVGTVSAFGASPATLTAWVLALALAAAPLAARPAPAGTTWDAGTRRFTLPGSAWPLALMMGIFFTKFTVGVQLALSPLLAHDATFGTAVAGIYGALSGLFVGRAMRLWRLALPAGAALPSVRPMRGKA